MCIVMSSGCIVVVLLRSMGRPCLEDLKFRRSCTINASLLHILPKPVAWTSLQNWLGDDGVRTGPVWVINRDTPLRSFVDS